MLKEKRLIFIMRAASRMTTDRESVSREELGGINMPDKSFSRSKAGGTASK